jgi:hypothetical protein
MVIVFAPCIVNCLAVGLLGGIACAYAPGFLGDPLTLIQRRFTIAGFALFGLVYGSYGVLKIYLALKAARRG